MAISYNDWKKKYEWLNDAQRQNYLNMTKNDTTAQQYMTQYNNEKNTVYTPSTTQNVTQPSNTFWDTWGASQAKQYTGTWVTSAGNYNYNPNLKTNQLTSGSLVFWTNAENTESKTPWYLEQRNNAIANALYNEWKRDENSVRNYLNTFSDFRNYDTVWQNNTVTAIMKRMWNIINTQGGNWQQDLNSRLQSEIWDNYEQTKKWYSDLMWWWANYYNNFWDAVNGKLKEAYWINNIDEFKAKYPEQYESLQQALSNVEWVWNATDPNERQMLDGRLQAIIGTWVWAGSDYSKLKVLESTLIDKFKDPDKIKQDAQNVIKLQTEWKNTQQIANEMWVSEDQVKQLILLANWLDSKAWEYYQLKDNVSKDITEPYDTKIARLEEEKKIALDRANRNVDWLKQDFDTNLERQKQQNDINAHNADAIAWRTWLAFSKRGIEWINYTATQAQQIIDDLTKNYDRNNQQMADGIADIIRNWQWNNQDLMKASEDALTRAKNSFTANTLAIQQQYWTVWLQAQQQLANNVQSFIAEAEWIYDNALARQQQNLSNLITNVSNLNALAAQNLTLRQAKIEQFQSEALNLNRSELQSLANQLWMDTASYQDLVTYQAQAVANELNWYVPGAWVMFQDEISSLLESGANWQEVLQWVMNQPEFKQMTAQANWWSQNWAMSNWVMYNKATWEYQNLNTASDERWSAWSWTIYNKATWEVKTVNWNTVSTTNANWKYQQVKLNEQAEDTWIPNVYWNTVKLAPTVWWMLNQAYQQALAQWVEIKVADSYRSYEAQKQAYDSWKEWVVSPDKSYHVIWQAFDLSQDSKDWMKNNKVVEQALLDAWFTRPNAKEWWHWSYWEWADAFWGKARNTTAYDTARSILSWVWQLPAKNSKEYTETMNALTDLVKQQRWDWYPEWEELINYSVINDKELTDTLSQTISSTMQSIYSTDMLNKLLDDNKDKIWPILSRLEWWNPYNADYAAINASIMQMASNVARWFWEKWVLTDADIERYMKTLPNQKMWKNAREVVWTLLKAKLYDWLVRTLETQAKSKRDVSMFISEYREAVDWLQKNWFRSWWKQLWTWVKMWTNWWRIQ